MKTKTKSYFGVLAVAVIGVALFAGTQSNTPLASVVSEEPVTVAEPAPAEPFAPADISPEPFVPAPEEQTQPAVEPAQEETVFVPAVKSEPVSISPEPFIKPAPIVQTVEPAPVAAEQTPTVESAPATEPEPTAEPESTVSISPEPFEPAPAESTSTEPVAEEKAAAPEVIVTKTASVEAADYLKPLEYIAFPRPVVLFAVRATAPAEGNATFTPLDFSFTTQNQPVFRNFKFYRVTNGVTELSDGVLIEDEKGNDLKTGGLQGESGTIIVTVRNRSLLAVPAGQTVTFELNAQLGSLFNEKREPVGMTTSFGGYTRKVSTYNK